MKSVKFNLLLLLLFLISFSDSYGQPMIRRTYGFGSINEARSIIQTFDHGYAIAGSTTPGSGGQTNFYFIKTDSLGNAKFHYSYGGAGVDRSYALTQIADSGFIIAGYSNSYNINNDYDACIIKIDKTGNMIWTKTFGTADWDFVYDLKPSPDGNFILIGNSFGSGSGNSSGYVVKINSDGYIIWQKFINNILEINLKSLAVNANGTFAVCGYLNNNAANTTDGFAALLDSSGDTLKTFKIDFGVNESFNAVEFFSNNDLAIAGARLDTSTNINYEIILRMDVNGNIVWYNSVTHLGDDPNYDIKLFNDSVMTIGASSSSGSGKNDMHIVLYDQNGAYVSGSGNTYGGGEDEFGYKGLIANDHGYVLVGTSTSYGPGSQSVFLVKSDTVFTYNPAVTIGIEKIQNSNVLKVYPNPVKDNLNISSENNQEDFSLNIYSIEGEKVLSFMNIKLPVSIPINLVQGIYFLELISKELIVTKKIIISD